MSRRSQQSLTTLIEKEKRREEENLRIKDAMRPYTWENIVSHFPTNLASWQRQRNQPMPEKLRTCMDLQFEIIRRSLTLPLNEERKEKILRQFEALSFLGASVAAHFNVPVDQIVF